MNFLILPRVILVKLITIVSIVVFGAPFLFLDVSWRNFFAVAPYSVFVGVFCVIVIGKEGWKYLWGKFDKGHILSKNIFPDINGIWEGVVCSNWGEEDGVEISFIAKVSIDFFSTKISFESNSGYTMSNIVISRLIRDEDNGRYLLYYIFNSETPDYVDGDERSHNGAARLEIVVCEENIFMQGNYWTDRNWKRKENTAGLIKFRRSV